MNEPYRPYRPYGLSSNSPIDLTTKSQVTQIYHATKALNEVHMDHSSS